MNTQLGLFKYLIRLKIGLLLLGMAWWVIGCAKKCPIPTERQTSVSGTAWRLVETNDPDFAGDLNNFSFAVFTFKQDFKGDVKVVINNTQYDSPVRTFVYNIDPNQRVIRIQYAFPSGADAQDGSSGSDSGSDSSGDNILDYYYSLGRTLELTSSQGFSYRFVPFTGILSPDDTCTF
jgi:hypothetical protein